MAWWAAPSPHFSEAVCDLHHRRGLQGWKQSVFSNCKVTLFSWSPMGLVVSCPNHLLNPCSSSVYTVYGIPTSELQVHSLFRMRAKPLQVFFCFSDRGTHNTLAALLEDLVLTLVSPLGSQNALSWLMLYTWLYCNDWGKWVVPPSSVHAPRLSGPGRALFAYVPSAPGSQKALRKCQVNGGKKEEKWSFINLLSKTQEGVNNAVTQWVRRAFNDFSHIGEHVSKWKRCFYSFYRTEFQVAITVLKMHKMLDV